MKIVVAGAGGMLGFDVVRAGEEAGHDVVPLTRKEMDVADPEAVERTLPPLSPDVVINCAAWTDVDGAEEAETEATRVNGEGAGLVASCAAAAGAAVIYVSSDYVFNGSKGSPYVESDNPSPLSAYGRSKLAGEVATAAANPRHLIARSSWLFGTKGRNFVETMLQLAADHGEVLVVHDQVGAPTYTAHLAEALVKLADSQATGVAHVAAAGRCSWYEFAQEIFDQTGVECRVMSATTEVVPRKAERPPLSALGSELPDVPDLPAWQAGLAAYLAERDPESATAGAEAPA